MSIERYRLAQVVVNVKLLIKRNFVKREGRSTSGLLVILAHGETATAKDEKKSVINDNRGDLQHQEQNSHQNTSYDEKPYNAGNRVERRKSRESE